MRVIHSSPIEVFVKGYLKNRKIRNKLHTDLLRKASTLIGEKIASTCCTNHSAVVNLYTEHEDGFTLGVRNILDSMTRQGNIKSLTRAKQAIDDYIVKPCCFATAEVVTLGGPTGTTELASAGTGGTFNAAFTITLAGSYNLDALYAEFYVNSVLVNTDINQPFSYTYPITVPAGGSSGAKVYFAKVYFRGGHTVTTPTRSITATDLS